jgi:hypothetical protein
MTYPGCKFNEMNASGERFGKQFCIFFILNRSDVAESM